MSTNPLPVATTPLGMAWAYHRDGRNEQAIAEFDRILKEHPTDIDATFGLGLAQRAIGRNEQALASFERARQLIARAEEKEPGDDRWEILGRMVTQRVAEIGGDGGASTLVQSPADRTEDLGVPVGVPVYTDPQAATAAAGTPTRPMVDFPSTAEIVGAIAAIVPFFLSFSSTSTETVDGEVVSQTYFDIVEVIGGIVAIVAMLSVIRLLGQTRESDRIKRYATIVVVLVLGVYQVLHGFGIIGL